VSGRDRHVIFDACFNFRDLGGYETVDGGRVKWGVVYRSGSLHRLGGDELDRALELGINTVIDLRSGMEVASEGVFGAAADVTFHHLPLEENIPAEPPPRDAPEPPPGEMYAHVATQGRGAIAAVLGVIAEGDPAIVFHCFAGKDRTGIVAALLLALLGVPDDAIVADYHLTDRSLAPSLAWADANDPEWAALMAAFPPWLLRAPGERMQAFLDILRARHGSIDGYLADAGVSGRVVGRLRDRLLEP
jgi:protein-tyrosine phosphatase